MEGSGMAAVLHLVCTDCREWCWIGQIPSWAPKALSIYSSEAENAKQARFYMKHLGHPLIAVADTGFDRVLLADERPLLEFE